MMIVMAVMLGEEVLTGLRQLVVVLVQAFGDAATAGHVTTERLHVIAAGLMPRGDLRLHLAQMCLALG